MMQQRNAKTLDNISKVVVFPPVDLQADQLSAVGHHATAAQVDRRLRRGGVRHRRPAREEEIRRQFEFVVVPCCVTKAMART